MLQLHNAMHSPWTQLLLISNWVTISRSPAISSRDRLSRWDPPTGVVLSSFPLRLSNLRSEAPRRIRPELSPTVSKVSSFHSPKKKSLELSSRKAEDVDAVLSLPENKNTQNLFYNWAINVSESPNQKTSFNEWKRDKCQKNPKERLKFTL